MTKDEAIKEALMRNKERVKQVKEIKKKNPEMPIADACKQIGWTFSQYYQTLKRMGKSPGLVKPGTPSPKKINYPAKRKSPAKITVTEVTAVASSKISTSFMLFGSPSELAEFVRAYG